MSRPASRMELVRADPLLVVTAVASMGAGAVHGAVAPAHTSWWPSVVFFVILAVFQIGWGLFVLMRTPGPGTLLLGAGISLVTLATWAVSRTSGIPVGPHRGSAEPAARVDLIASLLGVLVVLGALALFRDWRPHALRRVRPALSAAGGVAVTALSLVALTGVSGHAHSPAHDHGHEANLRPAAAFAEFSPEAAATTLCRGTVQAASDATFAKAAAAAHGDAAAITKAEAAATKQLKRGLAACGGAAAPAPVQPEEFAEAATAHADDGHSH